MEDNVWKPAEVEAPKGKLPISTAKAVARQHDLRQVILIGFDGENTHIVTYGKTKADCAAAARAQEFWAGKIRVLPFNKDPE